MFVALRSLKLSLILSAIACAPLQAQTPPPNALPDITGSWQGKLLLPGNGAQPGQTLRIVLKITRTPDGALSALNYSIDQSGQPATTSGVMLQGRSFKYAIPSYGASYEGQLSADNNAITGKWAGTITLDFARATQETAWEIPAIPEPLKPMTEPNPSFEVATIKPTDPDKPGKYFRVFGRTYSTHGTSLLDLIQVAYGLNPQQIVAPQSWVHDDLYDLTGTPDAAGEPNARQWLLMMQKLLANRFALVIHHEQQDRSVYVLSVAKGGPKNLTANESHAPLPCCMEFQPVPGGLLLPPKNASMGQFAQMMQQVVLDRPMVDHTGIVGNFDFQLTFMPNESQFNGHPPPVQKTDVEPAPDLAEALQQQLGLKLTRERIPTDVLVVDHVQKPSPN